MREKWNRIATRLGFTDAESVAIALGADSFEDMLQCAKGDAALKRRMGLAEQLEKDYTFWAREETVQYGRKET